jgi:predicted TIM-barrel fold metal-dependent hydrolase
LNVIDAHVHTRGHESSAAILAAMDRARIARLCLLSPPALATAAAQREALRFISRTTAAEPERLLGYFWLNPLLREAPALVEDAAATPGVRAFKLMSDHWYPHDERLAPALAAIQETGKPVLFHAGILWSHMDSSRFCRPSEFEVMLHYPRVRFALAHMAWPWVDECFAVGARMRDGIRTITGGSNTMYVDLSPGTPLPLREEALRRALLIGEHDRLLYGSDDADAESLDKAARTARLDAEILERLGASSEVTARIFETNLLTFLGMNEEGT